jgi:hypothetical protein
MCDGRDMGDVWTDSIFALVFLVDFVIVLLLSLRSFKRTPAMLNTANMLIVAFLLLTLLNRLMCLLYSLLINCNADIERNTVGMWFYFELPIAFINAATIVIFFEWTQFAQFITLAS